MACRNRYCIFHFQISKFPNFQISFEEFIYLFDIFETVVENEREFGNDPELVADLRAQSFTDEPVVRLQDVRGKGGGQIFRLEKHPRKIGYFGRRNGINVEWDVFTPPLFGKNPLILFVGEAAARSAANPNPAVELHRRHVRRHDDDNRHVDAFQPAFLHRKGRKGQNLRRSILTS